MATVTKPMALDETLQATNTILQGIGLASVGNVASLTTTDKTSLVAAVNELNGGKVSNSEVGVANGVAELDVNGKVPASQLPSFVDDVVEGYYYNSAFYEDAGHTILITGETGKIYIDLDTNKTYRWSGSVYAEISESLALGETSSTAYRGDRGKIAYDHSQDASRVTTATATGLYKVGATAQGHIAELSAIVKADLTGLGLADNDDVTALDGRVDTIESETDDNSTTATGNPLSFTTESAQLASDCDITLNPVQDLHGYNNPWVGGAGKNIFDSSIFDTDVGSSLTYISYNVSNGNYTMSTEDFPLVSNVTNVFFFAGQVTSGASTAYNGVYSNRPITINVTDGYFTIAYRSYESNNSNNPKDYKWMIEKGSAATSYAPYTNICPISGRASVDLVGCGKNLLEGIENGSWNTVTQTKVDGTYRARSTSLIKINPLTSYSFNASGVNKTILLAIHTYSELGNNKITGDYYWKSLPFTFTTGENDHYLDVLFKTSDDSANPLQYVTNPQIEEQSGATTYEPYTESTNITFTFGQTVYGGSIDVRSGVVTVDRAIVDLGTLDWNKISSHTNWFYTGNVTGFKYDGTSETRFATSAICSQYENIKDVMDNAQDGQFNLYWWNSQSLSRLWIRDDSKDGMSGTDFKTAMSGVQVCYELATPTTIQLTPHEVALLAGANTISTDGDSISITYKDGKFATRADLVNLYKGIKAYIDYVTQ